MRMGMGMSLVMGFLKGRMVVRSGEWDCRMHGFFRFWIDRQVMRSMRLFSS
jgi:hypothetical protein